jgi:hypothetical protein
MTKPQRYGASAAPRDDGIFCLYAEYEKVVAERDALRLSINESPEFIVAWLRSEGMKLSSSFNCDVYGPLFDAADQLEMLFCAKEQS